MKKKQPWVNTAPMYNDKREKETFTSWCEIEGVCVSN